jgi:N-acyl amino acid synthase of PEP-CTERM/exosortase system
MGAIGRDLPEAAFAASTESWQTELSLLARHDVFFETRVADCPALVEAAHALRYQVYCVERKFEDAEEHRTGLETDQYDKSAIQGVLFHRPSEQAIGTVRIIQPAMCGDAGLPIAQLLGENNIELAKFVSIADSVEVSRFAISKEFRRRWSDERVIADGRPLTRLESTRQANLPCLSLIQFLLRQCVEQGVVYWTAVMESTFLRMLARMGIHFTSIGPVVFHHGFRQPCYCYLPTMLEELKFEHPDYWQVITNGGELSERLALLLQAPSTFRKRA